MADFVYIDETGSSGNGGKDQPFLILVSVIVPENKVQPLSASMKQIALKHLGFLPKDFEFHGQDIWQLTGNWKGISPSVAAEAYKDVVRLLDEHGIDVSYSTINKPALIKKYNEDYLHNAYRLALQFLLEKLESTYKSNNKIVIADENKKEQLLAIQLLSDMQEWGYGEVPGRHLKTFIDSLHFVKSKNSFGVQLADMVAFVKQRKIYKLDYDSRAIEVLEFLSDKIHSRVRTYREPWPPRD